MNDTPLGLMAVHGPTRATHTHPTPSTLEQVEELAEHYGPTLQALVYGTTVALVRRDERQAWALLVRAAPDAPWCVVGLGPLGPGLMHALLDLIELRRTLQGVAEQLAADALPLPTAADGAQ